MLMLGAIASPHCALMCGALGMQTALRSTALPARDAMLWMQAGRIIGYAAAGSLAGGLGLSLVHAMPPPWFGELVRALGAAAVLVLGLHLLLRAPLGAMAHCHRPSPSLAAHWPMRAGLLIRGSAWALVPCGLLYSVLLMSALSASVAYGALLAGAFALGGSPALGWIGSRSAAAHRDKRHRTGAWLVALGAVSLLVIVLGGHAGLPAWCALER